MHKPMRVASGHSLGHQEWADPMRVASRDIKFKEGVIVTFHFAWVCVWSCPVLHFTLGFGGWRGGHPFRKGVIGVCSSSITPG
jgi:hypothetical protein